MNEINTTGVSINEKTRRIIRKLASNNLTMSTMEGESTAGNLARQLRSVQNAKSVVQDINIVFCDEVKIRYGMVEDIVRNFPPYSEEIAIGMARATKERANTDIGIGISEVDFGNQKVWYAFSTNEGTKSYCCYVDTAVDFKNEIIEDIIDKLYLEIIL